MSEWMPGAVRRPQPGGVTLDTSLPPRYVWHITWDQLRPDGTQPDFSAVANYLIDQQYCPNIMWNPFTGYMEQYYPASVGGRALKYNNQDGSACVQVEVFFTPGCVVDGVKYDTVADTPLIGWAELLAWGESLGVPRTWPMGAPQWTGNSRDASIWNSNAGHYGHCHSPGDTHTDPGPMPALAGITPQSATITPEGFLMALTDEQQLRLLAAADRINYVLDRPRAKVLTNEDLPAIADAVLHHEVEWFGFDGQPQPAGQRNTTTQALALGWSDAIATSQARLTNSVKEHLTSGAVDVQALAAQLAPLLSTQQAHQFIVALGAALPKE